MFRLALVLGKLYTSSLTIIDKITIYCGFISILVNYYCLKQKPPIKDKLPAFQTTSEKKYPQNISEGKIT